MHGLAKMYVMLDNIFIRFDYFGDKQIVQPAFNVGPPSARQRNAIEMVFCWRSDDGPILFVNWKFLVIKNIVRAGPPPVETF